jgi:hypothetical protein
VIAYVPHDPLHPLKQYPSSLEFMAELTRQLRDGSSANVYQRFFSQFVPSAARAFFRRVERAPEHGEWQPVAAGSNLPSWRETPVDQPALQFACRASRPTARRPSPTTCGVPLPADPQQDAQRCREIAIATEYADRMARWAWWDNLEKILSDMLNLAMLVAVPFGPELGVLMLAYTAYQVTDQIVEGIVDLAEGHLAQAGAQAIGVLESIVQLGIFAAGAGGQRGTGQALAVFRKPETGKTGRRPDTPLEP